MSWDIRIRLFITYYVLTTYFLVLNGSSIPTNHKLLSGKQYANTYSEADNQKWRSIENCTYQWPEVSGMKGKLRANFMRMCCLTEYYGDMTARFIQTINRI